MDDNVQVDKKYLSMNNSTPVYLQPRDLLHLYPKRPQALCSLRRTRT